MVAIMKLLLSAAILLVYQATQINADYRVVCYFGSWAVYRPDNGKFDVEDIDPSLCTHLIYGFAGLGESNSIKALDSWNELPDDYGKGEYRVMFLSDAFGRFVKLKAISPQTKVMLAIGGWNEGSSKYSDMASTASSRQQFADSVVAFLTKYGFDGLDVDWEYPAQRGGVDADKGLLLSAAVGASILTVDTSYDVPSVAEHLDMINVMTYDFHGSWDTITGENAPMYADSSETTELARGLNVDTCIQNWLAKGAPASKINLGMGTYGRSFTLQSADNSGLGAPISGAGTAGPYTREAGTLGYNEICEQKGQWTEHWNEDQQVPYAVNGNQWVGYDNVKSIEIKSEYVKEKNLGGAMIWSVETDDFRGICGDKYPLLNAINSVLNGQSSEYVKEKNLGGAMIWSVETDDFRGICGDKYPLLNAINSVLNGQSLPTVVPTAGPTTTTDPDHPAPPTTTTTTTPKPNPPDTGLCTQPGYVRDPSDCQVYYQCVDEGGFYEIFKFKCSDGTYFDPTIDVCNYTDEVRC
uniref:Chitinase n=1 Tax=Timema bartmani TaxID=61472 RepID=A0A7R9EYP4_9NEOP|nr:unnamed protein product [Timema bartmani]